MLFESDFLQRVEYLSLVSRRLFRGRLLAQRRTVQRGSGIEFAEHREYSPGDDLRYLDWSVYARLGDLLLKRFQEEQDLHVWLLLDCSRSMGFGEPAKFDLARQLVAALAYLALAQLDRVAVLAFADGVIKELPVTRGRARILPVLRFLESLSVRGAGTNLTAAAEELTRRGAPSGLAVVVSDLFDERGFQRGLDLLRYRKFDVQVIQLHAPEDADPRILGDAELLDIETGRIETVTVTERQLQTYQSLFRQHQQDVRSYCRQYSIGCTQAVSRVRFDDLLMQMMRETSVGT
jgi:uncharacterized protein (DUF58 family)